MVISLALVKVIIEDGRYIQEGNGKELKVGEHSIMDNATGDRYLREKLTAEELVTVQSSKGKKAGHKILDVIMDFDRRIKNMLNNPDQRLNDEELQALREFSGKTFDQAMGRLEPKLQRDKPEYPF